MIGERKKKKGVGKLYHTYRTKHTKKKQTLVEKGRRSFSQKRKKTPLFVVAKKGRKKKKKGLPGVGGGGEGDGLYSPENRKRKRIATFTKRQKRSSP